MRHVDIVQRDPQQARRQAAASDAARCRPTARRGWPDCARASAKSSTESLSTSAIVFSSICRPSARAHRAASHSCRAADAGTALCHSKAGLRPAGASAGSLPRPSRAERPCPLSPMRAKPLLGATTQRRWPGASGPCGSIRRPWDARETPPRNC